MDKKKNQSFRPFDNKQETSRTLPPKKYRRQYPQVVAITGASAGVGRAAAREFARMKAKIGLMARDRNRLETTAREIEFLGGEALVLPIDVANAEEIEAAAGKIEEAFGPLDIWVNNAMVSVFSPIKQMRPEEYRRVMEVTYLGYVHGTISALKRMLPRNQGTIVQVGSALASRAIPLQSAYCAAKHAIKGFTESLRCELLHDRSNVRVTLVNLPGMNTPQFDWSRSHLLHCAQPVPPIYQPEIAARAIVWAAKHPRRIVNIGLPTTIAWLGNKMMPRLGDHYLARTAYASQQTSELESPNRADNLWHTVLGPLAAHGRFDSRAKSYSLHAWFNTHRKTVAAGIAVLFGLGLAWQHYINKPQRRND